MLSFSYLCATKNNYGWAISCAMPVVICFHFLIFVPQRTTFSLNFPCANMLWFAFIFLSLCHKEQQRRRIYDTILRCDLLSFSYLCATKNNYDITVNSNGTVVICFHFLIFVPQRTTLPGLPACRPALWFAFIFLSLCHKEQRCRTGVHKDAGCDLLSFSYLCATKNNLTFASFLLN